MSRTAMDIALDLLARRGYSAKEMILRLRRAGMEPELAEEVTGECVRLGLINDEMYARDYAEILAARGLGGRRIRMELSRRGVAEFAGDAVDELTEGEPERALQAALGKMRLIPPADPVLKKRQKLYRFLSSRGFSPDVVILTVDKVLRGDFEEDF
jgi:regulatory protein